MEIPANKPRIDSKQLAVVLCICRLPAILFGFLGSGEEQVWAVLMGEAVRFLTLLLVCAAFFFGWKLPPFAGGVLRLAAAVLLTYSLIRQLKELGDFTADTLYPGSMAIFFSLTMLALTIYGVHMGLEAAARAALPVLLLFAAGMVLTALGVREEVRLVHLRPVEEISTIWKNGLKMGLAPEEMFIFLMAGRHTGGSKVKSACLGCGLAAVMTAAASFLSGTVLGSLQQAAAYPFFKTESLMSLSVFRRMDAWFLALWAAVIFLRCVFLCWAASELLAPYVKGKKGAFLALFGAAAAVFLYII